MGGHSGWYRCGSLRRSGVREHQQQRATASNNVMPSVSLALGFGMINSACPSEDSFTEEQPEEVDFVSAVRINGMSCRKPWDLGLASRCWTARWMPRRTSIDGEEGDYYWTSCVRETKGLVRCKCTKPYGNVADVSPQAVARADSRLGSYKPQQTHREPYWCQRARRAEAQ